MKSVVSSGFSLKGHWFKTHFCYTVVKISRLLFVDYEGLFLSL